MKKTVWRIALITAGALAAAACGAPKDPQAQAATLAAQKAPSSGAPAGAQAPGGRRFAAISVQAVTVQAGPLVADNQTAGTVMPVTQSSVAAQTAGEVSKVYARAGDYVKLGDVIVQIDDSALVLAQKNAQAALDNAKINLEEGKQTAAESGPKLEAQLKAAQNAEAAAQKTYDAQKALFDLGGISASQLDNAQSALQQAEANVQAAQLALDQNSQAGTQTLAQLQIAVDQAANQLAIARLNVQNAAIRAPFSGQLASVAAEPGMYMSATTTAFVLVSQDKQINFSMPPADAPSFRIGSTVQFTVNGKTWPVKIVQSPSAPINGVVPMVAACPPSLPVSYGAVGTVSYTLPVGTGPQIPVDALQSQANVNFVYTIVGGKAQETPITIQAESGAMAVVSGLAAGDQVIINPPPGLLSGSTVQVVSAPGQASLVPQAAAGGSR